MLGKIDGQLEGLGRTVDANHKAVNQRLDDLQKSNEHRFDGIERSFDGLETRVEHVESEQKTMIWKIAGWSGLSGALVTGVVELLKHAK